MPGEAAFSESTRHVGILATGLNQQQIPPENPLEVIVRLAQRELAVAPSGGKGGAGESVGARQVIGANDEVGTVAVEPEEGEERAQHDGGGGEDGPGPARHIHIVLEVRLMKRRSGSKACARRHRVRRSEKRKDTAFVAVSFLWRLGNRLAQEAGDFAGDAAD